MHKMDLLKLYGDFMPIQNTDLENLLTNTPIKISEISRKLVSAENAIEGKEKAIKRAIMQHLKEINAEIGADGKKKFLNEQARSAELEERVSADVVYQGLVAEVMKLKEAAEEIKIDLQEQINLFAAYKVVGSMRCH